MADPLVGPIVAPWEERVNARAASARSWNSPPCHRIARRYTALGWNRQMPGRAEILRASRIERTVPLSHPQESDSAGGQPCQSLTAAMRHVIHDAGGSADFDDLSAALGHCWMVSAAASERDLSMWPLYARDAFVIPAGRLFGLGIREIHPPEAARGIRDLPEFRQHFDASYHPLVLRALEHDQPVLAWQGWGGERGMLWGIIRSSCDDGIGLCGHTCCSAGSSDAPTPVPLERPPVQLYVVETATPIQPDAKELLGLALEHAGHVLGNALADRFGVLTGPAAYDLWLDRLRIDSKDTGTQPASFEGYRRVAASAIAAHRSGVRFLERSRAATTRTTNALIDAMVTASGRIVATLSEGIDAAARDHGAMVKALSRARQATVEMSDALEARP